jgi:Superinfection immunity protein
MQALGIGPTPSAGSALGLALLAGVVVYFAPTLLAIARHRGAAPVTFCFNLFLGWTGVGWVAAWFLAMTDRRLSIHVSTTSLTQGLVPFWPMQPPSITLAPDGRHWWDGSAWRDGWHVAPLGALWSPDGAHWFSGARWVRVGSPPAVRTDSPGSAGGGDNLPEEPAWWQRGH